MKKVDIFLITSAKTPGKIQKGWYRYMMYCGKEKREGHDRVLHTTGHRLVLECALAALQRMNKPAMITFWTDSHYFANGQRQIAGWKDNSWKRNDGKELKNQDLWQKLEEKLRPHAVQFQVGSMEAYKNPEEIHFR